MSRHPRITKPLWMARALVLALGFWGCSVLDRQGDGTPASQAGTGAAPGAGSSPLGGSGATGNAGSTGMGNPSGAGNGSAGNGSAGIGSAGIGSGGVGTGGTGSQPVDAGVASGGCTLGNRMFPNGATGILAADGCNTCSCQGGALSCTKIGCADTCIVARELDSCCGTHRAVLRSELAADECLVEYPGSDVDQARAQRCFEQSPFNCALVDCAPRAPTSRVAQSNGMGGCSFADECRDSEDCVLGRDTNACCGCVESIPTSLLAANACLVQEGNPPPAGCAGCALPVSCGACPEPPAAVTCVIGGAPSRCQ